MAEPAPPPKRRRIALACSVCRLRKTRCNGGHPKCSLCTQMGVDCSYEPLESVANVVVSRLSMTAFQERLDLLEARVNAHDALLARKSNEALSASTDTIANAIPNTTQILASGKTVALQEEPREDALTDGMAITFVSEDDSGFFGATSNIAFMRRIKRAMQVMGRGELNTPSMTADTSHLDSGVVSVSRPASPPDYEYCGMRDIRALPHDHETRDLLQRYFSNTGLLFPFIHETTFYQMYEDLRSGTDQKVRRTWLGLLNIMLAMASSTSVDSTKPAAVRRRESDVYYRRAHELCKKQVLRGASLETVQYLLLMSQYLQGTQKSVQTWATHGLAVKAAYSIGLHSSDASSRYPPVVQEMRRRAWYGCVVLDRNLSMTFGRPHTIPDDHNRLSLPSPFGDYSSAEEQRSDVNNVNFFVETIKLYQVQYKVVSALYEQNLGDAVPLSDFQTTTEVFRLEQDLNLWRHRIPEPLCIRSGLTVNWDRHTAREERFRVIITLRYLNLQTLLHRPFVAKSLSTCPASVQESQSMTSAECLAAESIQTCVKSAGDIISIVHTITSARRAHDLLGAWWFSLYYVFGASLTIFGALLIAPNLTANASSLPTRAEQGCALIRKACEAVRQLDDDNEVVARCADFLLEICRLLDKWRSSSTLGVTDEVQGVVRTEIPPLLGLDLENSQGATNEALFMNDFSLDPLEMGQFLLPDDVLHGTDIARSSALP